MSTQSPPVQRRMRFAAILASLLVAVALAGCSAGAEYSSEPAAAPDEQFADAGGDIAYEDGDGGTIAETSPENRSVIITGAMYMTVEDPIGAADKAAGIVNNAGGRIDARSETAPDEWYGGAAALTMRIPSDKLDAVVDQLRELGTVDEYNTDSSDVTNEVTDLDARISTLRASTERIEGLLAEAVSISDIITLENELASRQAELESLEARQRGLEDQVSLSTITLSLTTEPVVIVDEEAPDSFWDGLVSGWNALTAFVSGLLVILGVMLPWLIVLALIALAIVLVVRAGKSRKARRTAETAAPEPAPTAAPPAAK